MGRDTADPVGADILMSQGAKDTLTVDQTTQRGWPLVVACLAALCLSGWIYLGLMVADMVPVMDMTEAGPGMGLFNLFNDFAGLPAEARAALAALCLPTSVATFGMPGAEWGLVDLGLVFWMWLMMALAMMLPSAVPMLRAYFVKAGSQIDTPVLSTLLVAVGYLVIWVAYSVVATLAQWGLSKLGLLGGMMAPVHLALTASVLVVAGLYQFTPAKQACLYRCWYPRWLFLNLRHEEKETGAAFREGLMQGMACLGCCWAMMTLMFAVGLMNVLWVAALGVLMALEKTFPSRWFSRALGILLLAWGGALSYLLMVQS
ncbi:DUF2182 domain-containing protein [Roseibium sediminis]|uniref:DUF2182 domain-containing protein n=1 Tax=Roseibium sediminis TaxID=1775174 RepID=UPI001AD94149|nr:DUF2182 domain-containing protein [Roseibium sediminis]